MKLLMVLATLVFSLQGLAAETERVGGTYLVKDIKKVDESFFVIEFESQTKTGRFDFLRLESDHVHVAVKVGDTLRISAEVLTDQGTHAEIAQVLLFLPHVQGFTPVWMLSRKSSVSELGGSNYLEMHAPQSDYAIF